MSHAEVLRDLLAEDNGYYEAAERDALAAAIRLLEAEAAPAPPTAPVTIGARSVEFVVYGDPKAQGSKSLGHTKTGQAFMREANAAELRLWRRAVRDEAKARRVGWAKQAPIVVELTFMFRATRDKPIGFKVTAPDIDKLCRAVLDSCTDAGMWTDDAQVVKLLAQKVHGSTPGVRVRIRDVS